MPGLFDLAPVLMCAEQSEALLPTAELKTKRRQLKRQFLEEVRCAPHPH